MIRAWHRSSPGGAGLMRSSQSVIGQLDWGFHIVRGGAGPGHSRFHPRGVGVVVIRRVFRTGDGALSSPGCVRSTRLSQSVIGR